MKRIAIVLLIIIGAIGCAKRGMPSGGAKDTEAPVVVHSLPENYTTNFKGNEIKISFDEYIRLKDLNKHLIVSPPLKYRPIISPQSGASKYLKIEILDTLQENTTYAFNFGKSIVDNNEGNPYPYFKYVFSTGTMIDSLTLGGSVTDALSNENDKFVSVMLYEVDSTFTDSSIYTDLPRYITNTSDSATTFQIENIKAGKYQLVALKEKPENYKFNQKTDKIAFVKEHITLPTDKAYDLKLFKEIEDYKALKPKHHRKHRIRFKFHGPYAKELKINLLSKNLPDGYDKVITKDVEGDTLNYWFKPALKLDSLRFEMVKGVQRDTFTVRIRKKVKADSLKINLLTRMLDFDEDFTLGTSTPITSFDKSKMTLSGKDSIPLGFELAQNVYENKLIFRFKKEESERYQLLCYPGAFTDFFGEQNDTIKFVTSTRTYADYGNMKINLINAPTTPIIIQLTTDKGEVKYEQKGVNKTSFDFKNIAPATYLLRVVFDDNGNGLYDTGNYLQKRQPERVSYYPEGVEVRANWDIDQSFTLKKE